MAALGGGVTAAGLLSGLGALLRLQVRSRIDLLGEDDAAAEPADER